MIESIFLGYAIFAVTTALTSLIVILLPVLDRINAEYEAHPIKDSPIIALVTFTIMAVLVAPLLFITMLLPNGAQKEFIDAFYESLTEE